MLAIDIRLCYISRLLLLFSVTDTVILEDVVSSSEPVVIIRDNSSSSVEGDQLQNEAEEVKLTFDVPNDYRHTLLFDVLFVSLFCLLISWIAILAPACVCIRVMRNT